MAFIYGDPTNATLQTSYGMKDVQIRAFKLPVALWKLAGVNTNIGTLPVNSSIVGMETWVSTAITVGATPTLSVGTTAAGTQFANAFAVTNTTVADAGVGEVYLLVWFIA
jgi:hypothetical protein